MPVIWGLDLREIRPNKFKSSYMWSRKYHLRRTKFIVYQLAMILTVVSESLGTAALSDYIKQQESFAMIDAKAVEYNDDMVGICSYNIFSGVYVATIFGAAFFFDLIWPERYEPHWVRYAWKVCSVFAVLFCLGAAIGLTIIVPYKCASVTGVDAARVVTLVKEVSGVPLCYRKEGRAVAALAFIWPGFLATIAATYFLWVSQNHDDLIGPLSTNARPVTQRKDVESTPNDTPLGNMNEPKLSAPEPVVTTNGSQGTKGSDARVGAMDRWDRQNVAGQAPLESYAGT